MALNESDKKILIMTAVEVEREAVLRGIKDSDRFDVMIAGVGPASAAATTATILAKNKYDLVVSMGIGGGFVDQTEVGSVVVANEIIAADLGAATGDGFSTVDELGFGSARIAVEANLVTRVTDALLNVGLPVTNGPVLTLSTVTGTRETALELSARIPGAAVEAMEGFGVATAAQIHGIPVLEIRTISNPVGPRDRDSWKIKEALIRLEEVSSIIVEVL